MQITKIEKQGRKLCIYLNDEPAFSLYPSEMTDYHLEEGQELEEQAIQEIYSAVLLKRAELRCLNLLKSRDRTCRQLTDQLKREDYPDEVIAQALSYVASYHYVDDAAYARRYFEEGQGVKTLQRMKADLAARGVSSEDIEAALMQLADDGEEPDDQQALAYWIRKRRYDPENADEKERTRMIRFLMSKGFSYSEIRKAIAHT